MLFSNTGYHNAASKILEQVGYLTFSIAMPLLKKWENMFAVKGTEIAPKFNLCLKILHPWFLKSELWNTAYYLLARTACLPLASRERCHAAAVLSHSQHSERLLQGTCTGELQWFSDPPSPPVRGFLPAYMLTNCFPGQFSKLCKTCNN